MITTRNLCIDDTLRRDTKPKVPAKKIIPKKGDKPATIHRKARQESLGSIVTIIQIDAKCDSTGEKIRSETYVTSQIPYTSFLREKTFEMWDKLAAEGYKVRIEGHR